MSGLNSIEGLASNLNTTDIINATITYERQPAVLMEQRQAEITKEISTFNALSAKLLALETSIKALNSRTKFSQASILVSNESLLTATAEDAVGNGTYSLNILSLAGNHQIASQGFDDPTQTVMGTGTITIALGDQSSTIINISQGDNSLIGIKNAINDANTDVTASIINDGSNSRPYRLVLTGNKTGLTNKISFTDSLTGGLDIDFENSSFDNPEELNFSAQATSTVSLGATAGYTGAANKVYIFTVGGSGTQTVGDGNITINWVDSTDPGNSGSIIVDQADKIIEGGPEGLTLTFGSGDLVAGDTFQVTAFAPLLQQASDAQISIGSSAGGASPIVISSDTNQFEDVIPGLKLDIKGVTTEDSGPVTIQTGMNVEGIKQNINSFISAYNDAMSFIDDQNKYDSETEEAGVLMGDLTLMTIQSRLQNMIASRVKGLDSSINTLSAVGIRAGATGRLSLVEPSKLTEALEDDFEAVLNLFVDSGSSSMTGMSFVSGSSEIESGTAFKVDITQAATNGYLEGTSLDDFASGDLTLTENNNKVKLRVDGLLSEEIVLSTRTYSTSSDLVNELQTRINADKRIGDRGVLVKWLDEDGNNGHIEIVSSSYGSSSKIEIIASIANNAYSKLGLASATAITGDDVAGTINGEKATGNGQFLTGNEGNSTTDGLKLLITLGSSQVVDGEEGTVTFAKGISSILGDGLESITKSTDGVIGRKTEGLEKEVENIKSYIEDFDERLMLRRERLEKMWADLETTLSQLQSQGDFLSTQLEQISSNMSYIVGGK
jgi:flagellar hook-associated protein 2